MSVGEIVPKENTIVEPETDEKPVIKVEPPQDVYDTNKSIVKLRRVIWYIWLVVEILLLIRFLLRFFGANPDNTFNILITIFTFPFVLLFSGMFSSTTFLRNNEIEWSTLFAMFIYLLLAFVVARSFKLKKPVDPNEAESKAAHMV